MMVWMEGIGSSTGLLYNEIPQNGCVDDDYYVSCFWERGVYVGGGTFCDYNTGLNEITQNGFSFSIYPNPLTSVSFIDLKETNFKSIEIYNVFGQQVEKYGVDHVSKIILSRKDFKNGIYICRIFSKDEKYFTVKFIVQ